MLHDGLSCCKFEQVLDPVVATSTQTSSAIAVAGCGELTVIFGFGAEGDTLSGSIYWTCSLQDCDDDSNYVDVADAYVIGQTTNDIVVDVGSEAGQCYRIGYIGSKKYVKAVITATGSHSSGTPVYILALKGRLGLEPAATPDS